MGCRKIQIEFSAQYFNDSSNYSKSKYFIRRRKNCEEQLEEAQNYLFLEIYEEGIAATDVAIQEKHNFFRSHWSQYAEFENNLHEIQDVW